jgi:glycosyltransferase involved in cell wall biosynthesis
MRKVLVVSHGHPEFNKGGGELAAYQFFQESLKQGDDAYFLARTDQIPHGGAAFSSINNEREILFHTTHDDFFLFSNIKTRHLWKDFSDLLLKIKPDVIYFHHYFLIGIEALEVAKSVLPNVKIVLTLHEYYAICPKNGLMLKNDNKLCYESGSLKCQSCIGERSPGDFFLRERYIKRMFHNVDHFVSPSEFLRQRYIQWGLQQSVISCIENGQPNVGLLPFSDDNTRIQLTYIGQINTVKGLDIILEALLLLPEEIRDKFQLNIHGSGLKMQPVEFQSKVAKLVKKLKGIASLHGTYEAHELPDILAGSDWVVVPSIWWENSPMVIQESLNFGRPLIVSDIGGMVEKVQHEVTGLTFRAGKAYSLANVLNKVAKKPGLRDTFSANINKPTSLSEAYQKIRNLA